MEQGRVYSFSISALIFVCTKTSYFASILHDSQEPQLLQRCLKGIAVSVLSLPQKSWILVLSWGTWMADWAWKACAKRVLDCLSLILRQQGCSSTLTSQSLKQSARLYRKNFSRNPVSTLQKASAQLYSQQKEWTYSHTLPFFPFSFIPTDQLSNYNTKHRKRYNHSKTSVTSVSRLR